MNKQNTLHRLLPLLVIGLFASAMWVLHNELRHIPYQQIIIQLKNVSAAKLLWAIGLTILGYWAVTAYDRLAVIYIQHPVAAGRITLASFISYAFSNSIGLSLLTGGTIRYRLYSSWGLAGDEITKLVGFTVVTFWLGILSVGSVLFLLEPLPLPFLHQYSNISTRPIGVILWLLVIGYLIFISLRNAPVVIGNWQFSIPSLKLAASQLVIGALDWTLAASVLFVLLPGNSGLNFGQFLGIFLLAQVVALISHVPGGVGVFESMILLTTPGIPADALFGSMLLYRIIYYLIPLGIAAVLLSGSELLQKRSLFAKSVLLVGRWTGTLLPQFFAVSVLISGAILLLSGATPAVPQRLDWVRELLPLPVIEVSHFLGSLIGAGLLILARGLQRRLDAAFLVTCLFLGLGSLLSLLKGGDYEEALILAMMLLALLPCRKQFYRKASLFSEPFTSGWLASVILILAATTWLGFFAYKHVAYSNELWWHFTLYGNAPRFLRASVGVAVLLVGVALAKLLRTVPKQISEPGKDELSLAKEIIAKVPETTANLALLGDKSFLFDDSRNSFVMYAVQGRSWIALAQPVGPSDDMRDLAWKFREWVERHGGQPVFYEIGTTLLPVCLDMGLTLYKIGESAKVPLTEFSLTGSKRKGLRYSYRRLTKDGCSFEVVPVDQVPPLLAELRRISDAWLKDKKTREKGFSLGRFEEDYLLNFPLALVKQESEIVAFANIWLGADFQEISVDLMRFSANAPPSTMDFLFVGLMLWGREQGYQFFDLGMAPLSGLENRPFAPLWNRIGAVIFRQGEHFYNFEGLRDYKDKFNPIWEPRYLACPGGLGLPRVLLNVAALISGGFKGLLGK